jgi:nucleotide-binding universal stress UspA family protein
LTIKTILVPTDFSEPSAAALAYAKQLADAFRSSIHLLYVTQNLTEQSWAAEGHPRALAEILGQLKLQAQRNLAQALTASDRKKYRAKLVVEVGVPFSRILQYAKRHSVDLIVIGTHGRGAVARAIVGSVTERVVRFAPCPVLAVREQDGRSRSRRRPGSRPTSRRIIR